MENQLCLPKTHKRLDSDCVFAKSAFVYETHPVVCATCGQPATHVAELVEEHWPNIPGPISVSLRDITPYCDKHIGEQFHDYDAVHPSGLYTDPASQVRPMPGSSNTPRSVPIAATSA